MVDYAVVAVGAKPNTSLAEVSELETHSELGGYLVNAELEARTDLYVVSLDVKHMVAVAKLLNNILKK